VSVRHAVLIAFAPALLGACGGGDGGGDASSRGDFVQAGEAICLDAQLELEAIPQPVTAADLGAWAGRYVRVARRQVERLRRLNAPEAIGAEARAFVETLDESVDAIADLGTAARRGQANRVQPILERSRALAAEARERARAVGLDMCVPSG
jgi:hypothetical protein